MPNFIFACQSLRKDYSKGFGGKFGVQRDRQDKSAAGWDHFEKVEKHESQKGKICKWFWLIFASIFSNRFVAIDFWLASDYSQGFGGKFGVQNDRMDKSALTYDVKPTPPHASYKSTKPEFCEGLVFIQMHVLNVFFRSFITLFMLEDPQC